MMSGGRGMGVIVMGRTKWEIARRQFRDFLAREAAQEKLRVATEKYKVEAALLKDTLQAQASLSEANAQYDQALLSFWTARADLDRALGEDH